MSDLEFDFVVIGAGIVGSWTAKDLTKYGKVLLLEQFREPHTRGSSHGQSRLIRSGYREPFFAEMMPHAFKMWRQAETETNEKLIETTGALYVADPPINENLMECIKNLRRLCPENLIEFNSSDMKLKYPDTLNYGEDCLTVFDKSGGVIFAHKSVKTIQKWFENSGGIMWDGCKVNEIVPLENKVLVKTCRHDVLAKSLIVTSGPWTKKLLDNLYTSLPLQPVSVKVYYWKEKKEGVYSASSGFPAVLDFNSPHIFSLPSLEYPGLIKLGIHSGVPCDPDERDKTPVHKEQLDIVKKYVKKHFPLLETEPAIIEDCMYTCTPDEVFLIDRLPGYKNIVIGTGFSGTGFKTAPVVGRLLSELVRGVEPFLDITPYRLSRFPNVKSN